MRFSARVLAILVLSAAAAAPAGAEEAHDVQACQVVTISGTITGTRTIGPVCAPLNASHCEEFAGGASPQANYYLKTCFPL